MWKWSIFISDINEKMTQKKTSSMFVCKFYKQFQSNSFTGNLRMGVSVLLFIYWWNFSGWLRVFVLKSLRDTFSLNHKQLIHNFWANRKALWGLTYSLLLSILHGFKVRSINKQKLITRIANLLAADTTAIVSYMRHIRDHTSYN